MQSNHKLHYFKDQKTDKEQGVIDLSIAYAVSDIKQGLGFEIATPGRTWTFKAEDKTTQSSWMAALAAMLNDLREIKKEQQAATGYVVLKASEAAYRDDREDTHEFAYSWWELSSTGEKAPTTRKCLRRVLRGRWRRGGSGIGVFPSWVSAHGCCVGGGGGWVVAAACFLLGSVLMGAL